MGVGETTISCQPEGNVNPRPVLLKVIKASPALQSFNNVRIHLGQEYTLTPPSSLNKTGSWTYTIVNDDPTKPAATVENGRVLPRNIGRGKIIATQAETAFYKQESIEANLEVKALAPTAFETMYVTFGDPAFPVPRPSNVLDTVSLTYAIDAPADLPPAQQVASINSETGVVTILKAGTTTIKALQGETVVARGLLVVDKARTHLVFRLPVQSFHVDFCGGTWMSWPAANQPEDSATVKGLLQTNNPEGALVYRGQPLNTALALSSGGGSYNFLNMKAIYEESRPFTVYVEQLESENYYGARTDESIYWAQTNIRSCSQ